MSRALVNEAALHAYLDGLLPEERRAEVEAYLKENLDAAERVAAYRQQNEALHSLSTRCWRSQYRSVCSIPPLR